MNIFWIVLIALSQHAQQHHNPQHSFEDTDRWVEEFENSERDAQQRPDEVVQALNLAAGDVVADIGAGTGYFTRRFAKAVGDTGIAYAVDLEPNMLKYIAELNEDSVVIPGHGPVATYDDMKAYMAILETIRARIVALIDRGASLSDVIAAKPTAEWDEAKGDPVRLIDRAYRTLTRD